jgi:drug/metabolite transporter (DMT)-like permease
MKLNFWQWLGLALLVLGVYLYVFRGTQQPANPPSATTAPLPPTVPATVPATLP